MQPRFDGNIFTGNRTRVYRRLRRIYGEFLKYKSGLFFPQPIWLARKLNSYNPILFSLSFLSSVCVFLYLQMSLALQQSLSFPCFRRPSIPKNCLFSFTLCGNSLSEPRSLTAQTQTTLSPSHPSFPSLFSQVHFPFRCWNYITLPFSFHGERS